MSTTRTMTFALSTRLPTHSPVMGLMSNTTLSLLSLTVTGTAADDVTAASENTMIYTEWGLSFKEVVTHVINEARSLATVIMSAAAVAPSLSMTALGTVGTSPCESGRTAMTAARALMMVVTLSMLTTLVHSSKSDGGAYDHKGAGTAHKLTDCVSERSDDTHVCLPNRAACYCCTMTPLTTGSPAALSGSTICALIEPPLFLDNSCTLVTAESE